jgi:hypothetical protein
VHFAKTTLEFCTFALLHATLFLLALCCTTAIWSLWILHKILSTIEGLAPRFSGTTFLVWTFCCSTCALEDLHLIYVAHMVFAMSLSHAALAVQTLW